MQFKQFEFGVIDIEGVMVSSPLVLDNDGLQDAHCSRAISSCPAVDARRGVRPGTSGG